MQPREHQIQLQVNMYFSFQCSSFGQKLWQSYVFDSDEKVYSSFDFEALQKTCNQLDDLEALKETCN